MTRSPAQQKALDFAAIKARVPIVSVLAHYGIELRGGGTERMARCPFHEDRSPSLQVNVEKNLLTCFACGASGSVLDFVAKKEGCDLRAAAEKLLALEGTTGNEKAPAAEATGAGARSGWREEAQAAHRRKHTPARNRTLDFRLSLDPNHPYLTSRGLLPETVRHFGLGFCEHGLLRGRIAIPIHDEGGRLVAYAGRWAGSDDDLPEGEGKYKFPRGFKKSLVLYNLHRVRPVAERVIVVEGFFGLLAVHQAGHPDVVALMGSALSREHRELLVARFREVVILLDGDEAGVTAAIKVERDLTGRVAVRRAHLPTGAQPDSVSAEELREVLSC